jgi:hypothetical protein
MAGEQPARVSVAVDGRKVGEFDVAGFVRAHGGGERGKEDGDLDEEAVRGVCSSVSVYLGPPIWRPRSSSRLKGVGGTPAIEGESCLIEI